MKKYLVFLLIWTTVIFSKNSNFEMAEKYNESNDREMTKIYLLKAVGDGYSRAMTVLGFFYDSEEKVDLAEKYFLMALDNNAENAIFNL